jgi:Domain of unknown function (DUF4381)
MSDDPGSLSNLHDLALPPPIPFWPPASGIFILAAGLLAVAAIAAWYAVSRYRANAYRRAALAEIDAIETSLQRGATVSGDLSAAVFAILKRATLAAFPRDQTASLSGTAFVSFLARSGPKMDVGLMDRMAGSAYDPSRPTRPEDVPAFLDEARSWIRRHEADVAQEA